MRLLLAATLDPDGAMFDWLADVEALGVDVLPVPTQTAVHHLGPRGLSEALVAIATSFRPHVVLGHPPYDHLTPEAAAALRTLGARTVGFAFDDPIVWPRWDAAGRADDAAAALDATWDLVASVSPGFEARVPRGRRLRWATSARPHEARAELGALGDAASGSAVLIGRAYPRRAQLLGDLAPDDFDVLVFGHGWEGVTLPERVKAHGPVTREAMNALYAAAGCVITTGDWEDAPVGMVKYRLLEAAACGATQAVQRSPDLADYADTGEIATWETADELRAAIREALATTPSERPRMGRKHRWRDRWPELLAALDEVGRPLRDVSGPSEAAPAAWRQLVTLLGHAEETRGAIRVARELFSAVSARCPDHWPAAFGLARCEAALGRPGQAASALVGLPEAIGPVEALHMTAPAHGRPAGLGRAGYLDPTVEARALRLSSLVEAGDATTAAIELEALASDPDALMTVASMLAVPDPTPRPARAFWRRLCEAALEAEPRLTGAVQERHRARWRASLDALDRRR